MIDQKSGRKRFRLRFSLRTVLLAMTLVAVAISIPVRRAYWQRRASDWVREQSGHLSYDYQFDFQNRVFPGNTDSRVPDWMISLLGIDLFHDVDTVVLDNQEVKTIEPLLGMKRLRVLGIFIEVDPATDFSRLQELDRLEMLHFDYSGLDREAVDRIRSLLPDVEISFDG